MNWEKIQYIFQIPISWYKKIHERVFNTYGTNFITVKDGYYGGAEIGVDQDAFKEQVNMSLTDVVRSVDSVAPNQAGNVVLNAVKSVNGRTPDENGNVFVPFGAVQTVDHESPDSNGNVQLNAIRQINGHNGNSQGQIWGIVSSVNGETPDDDGAVEIECATMEDIEDYIEEQSFATIQYVTDTLEDYVTASDLSGYATKSELQGYATLVEVDDALEECAKKDDIKDFVTKSTTQTITGVKTFNADQVFQKSLILKNGGTLNMLSPFDFNSGTKYYGTYYKTADNQNLGVIIAGQSGANIRDFVLRAHVGDDINSGIWLRVDTSGQEPAYYQLLNHEPPRLYSTGVDEQIASRGYCRLNFSRTSHDHGNIANDGKLTSYSGSGTVPAQYVAADANGTMFRRSMTDLATKDELQDYATKTDLESYTPLTSFNTLDNSVDTLSDSLEDLVDTVQQINNNYATKTDLNSYATKNELTSYATIQYVSDGYATKNDISDFVTKSTTQTITGVKTFNADQTFLKSLSLSTGGTLKFFTPFSYNLGERYYTVPFNTSDNHPLAAIMAGQTRTNSHELILRAYSGNNVYSGIWLRVDTSGETPVYSQLLNNEPSRLYSEGSDAQIASRGYCRLNFARTSHEHGNIDNSGKLTSYSGSGNIPAQYVASDSNGTMFRRPMTDLATKDDLDDYASKTDLQSYTPLASFNTLNTSVGTLTDTLDDLVDTVQQINNNYATKSDLTSYATKTELTSYATTQYVSDNYATKNDISDFVTKSTTQTITGVKTFNADQVFQKSLILKNGGTLNLLAPFTHNLGERYYTVPFKTSDNQNLASIIAGQSYANSHELILRANGTSNTFSGIWLRTDNSGETTQYSQLLTNEPARLYSDGADAQIASRGYCRLNFSRGNHTHGTITNDGKITTAGTAQTDYYIAADSSGNLYRRNKTEIVPDLTNYATKTDLESYTPLTSFNTLNTSVGTLTDTLDDLVDTVQVIQNDYVTQNDLTAFVKQVDGHAPDANGDVSFNLTGNKWVKTDGSGHIATTDETPISLPSGTTGQTTSLTVVTGISWNGTQIVATRTQLNFTNGVLTGTTSQSNTTINTISFST